jgi:two-component system sensor histidine kinase/response regulator
MKKILIVDDEPENIVAITDIFEKDKLPYELINAPSGCIALKIIEKTIPDLIITDWEMPVMDGVELIDILQQNEITKDIPVIMCTGVMTTSENLYTALKAGAVDYIRKPIDRLELIARTRANLNLADNLNRIKQMNQSLIELSQFKEDMTNMIVHDLKSPLNIIVNSEVIGDEDLRLDMVKESGYRMLNLIHNILDVYKYGNVAFDLNIGQFRLVDVINDALNEVNFIVKNSAINVVINENVNIEIKADKELIRRVFSNLLSNAVKFSPTNGTITIDTIVDQNNMVRVSVANDGPCIPKVRQEYIFERFGQNEKRDSGHMSSTGLGLTFCKMAIEAHKGKIGVISETDTGVEFWFTLPESKNK